MPKNILVGFLLSLTLPFISLSAFSQHTAIKGRVTDSTNVVGLPYSTVSLVNASDSALVTYTMADSTGDFKLDKVSKGNYLLSVSHTGYTAIWRSLSIPGTEKIYDAGTVALNISQLQEVNVVARRPPVEFRGDTVEYNTENFKTRPHAVVEDMLKKMPGLTVDKNGVIKVNGKVVQNVLVNGKRFFTGNPTVATQNLEADAVDKVQVYDKKSDQALFTGIDDGIAQKTINLKLKKGRDHSIFGRLTGGGGTRYDAQANVNLFQGDKQMSFLGMANNINRQGISIMDALSFSGGLGRGGGGLSLPGGLPLSGVGPDPQGITTSQIAGFNYNNLFNKGKTDFSGSYIGNNNHTVVNQHSFTQNVLPGVGYNTYDTSGSVTDKIQHQLSMIIDHKVNDKFSYKLTPSIGWLHSHSINENRATSLAADSSKLNDSQNHTASSSDAVNAATEVLIRQRLAKKGRTISADLNMAYSSNVQDNSQLSDYTLYTGGSAGRDSSINQVSNQRASNYNLQNNIIYTEPIGKRSLLALKGFFNINTDNNNTHTYDYNSLTGKHDLANRLLSNDLNTTYTYRGANLSFQANQKKSTLSLGASLQTASLRGKNLTLDSAEIRHSYTDILPNAMFQYRFSKLQDIRVTYNTNISQPSVTQLLPVTDVSNPLSVVTGNPQLKRSYTHDLSLNYNLNNHSGGNNLFFTASFSKITNSIVNSDSVTSYGKRFSHPVNTNGVSNLFGNISYNLTLPARMGRIGMSSNFTYGKNLSYINGVANFTTNTIIGPALSYNFSRDNIIDLSLRGSVTLNKTDYSPQTITNTRYWQQSYDIDVTGYLSSTLSINSDFNYTINTGNSNGYNVSLPRWNASIAKSMFKNNRGQLKLSVQDILNQNTGISQFTLPGYIYNSRYNVLQRYALLSFTYSLNKAGGKNDGGTRIQVRTITR